MIVMDWYVLLFNKNVIFYHRRNVTVQKMPFTKCQGIDYCGIYGVL